VPVMRSVAASARLFQAASIIRESCAIAHAGESAWRWQKLVRAHRRTRPRALLSEQAPGNYRECAGRNMLRFTAF